MTRPVRIQRKRVKGFDMRAESRAINGLDCVFVGGKTGWAKGIAHSPERCREAVERFPIYAEAIKESLRGKNLACSCPLDAPCHADVLLEIANEE